MKEIFELDEFKTNKFHIKNLSEGSIFFTATVNPKSCALGFLIDSQKLSKENLQFNYLLWWWKRVCNPKLAAFVNKISNKAAQQKLQLKVKSSWVLISLISHRLFCWFSLILMMFFVLSVSNTQQLLRKRRKIRIIIRWRKTNNELFAQNDKQTWVELKFN